MIISDLAVRNRITVFVLTAMIVLAGAYSYSILPRESAPEVIIPIVNISTSYRGVSPEDMENSVTREIEDKLKGLKNVKKISSVSAEGRSNITVEFITGTDIDDAVQKVKDKIDLAKAELPNDLDDDPFVKEVNTSEWPIYSFAIAGPAGEKELRDIAEDLEALIEGIPGVLEVDVVGGVEREIHIEVDPNRMILYNVPFAALGAVVSGENRNISGGSIRTVQGKYQLRLEGEFENAEQAENIVVRMGPDNSPVYLRDIATVSDGFVDRYSVSRLDGESAVTVSVKKRAGENILEIVDDVDDIINRERETWPPGTTMTVLDDRSKEISNMISDLENNITSGLLLVIIVVCIAMGLRNAILVSLSIPLSMLMGFCILSALGVTLNMVVLFSLTLALGMLVDNAVVIIENIYRFMQQGVPRLEAAMRATSEVALPIIGSGMTTIAAFVPLLWWTGVMGDFMVYLPITVITVLSSCLFVAIVINPALAAVFMKAQSPDGKVATADEVMAGGEHPMLSEGHAIITVYRKLLRIILGVELRERIGLDADGEHELPGEDQYSLKERIRRHFIPLVPRLAVLVVAVLFLFTMLFFWLLVMAETPVQFFPSVDPEQARVYLDMPEGADLQYCDNVTREAEMRIFDEDAAPHPDGTYPMSYAEAARPREHTNRLGKKYQSPSDIPNVENCYVNVNSLIDNNFVSVMFPEISERTEKSTLTLDKVEARMNGFTGAKITVQKPQHGPPTGAPINIEIVGDDLQVLGNLASEIRHYVLKVPYLRNVRDDYASGMPTFRVQVNRQRAAILGLSSQEIGYALRAAINGIEISTYREGDDDYDIIVRFPEKDRKDIGTLERIFIPTIANGPVPLTTVAQIRYIGGLGEIHRIDHTRVVTVQADIIEGKTTGDTARRQAENLLKGSPFFEAGQIFKPGHNLVDIKNTELPPAAVKVAEQLKGAPIDWETKDEKVIARTLNAIIRQLDYLEHRELITTLLNNMSSEVQANDILAEKLNTVRVQALRAETSLEERYRFNRMLLELLFDGTLVESNSGMEMPPGYRYQFTGEQEEQEESQRFMAWALMVALCLIFLILVSQFNSVLFPFIILSSVILSLAGVFMGLGLCQMPFGVIMTGLGVISLAGVVVNNAIVLIDYTIQLIERGMKRDEAIIAAGATRLRPVILTAVTTVLGLVPMATGISWDFHLSTFGPQLVSESNQWWGGMAVAVIFGLSVATTLTLFVVPVLFSLLSDITYLIGRSWELFKDYLKRSFASQK